MINFEIIDNGLINIMSQSATLILHSIFAVLTVVGLFGAIFSIICSIKGPENPILCITCAILLIFLVLFTISAPFMIMEDNIVQTYKAKPTANATIEDMLDFEMKYGIIAKEDDWYIVYEK